MTTGPIYLVSACSSGEEFVSAFRRYADRNGVLFVPIAQPLAPGKKGRFALTLKDGGVMIEGEAEVVSSAKTPSVLYGRIGMTLKFTGPDEPSRTILTDLDKARTAIKPPPPSVAPRPADIPAEPRPTPPAPAGRVDAVNALAECVAIGDLSALGGDDVPPKIGGPKFVVPSIPPVGPGARPKAPTTPPAGTATTMGMPPLKAPTGPQPTVPKPPPPRTPTPAQATPVVGKETVMGMPALDKAPAPTSAPPAVGKETVMGMPALGRTPGVAATREPREDPTMPTPASAAAAAAATKREESTMPTPARASAARDNKIDLLQTMRGPAPGVDLITPNKAALDETMRGPAPKLPPAAARPAGTAPPPVPKQPTPPAATPVVARQPTPPVVARQPTPPAASPIVPAPPIVAAPPPVVPAVDDTDEPTDLTSIPIEPPVPKETPPEKSGREPRRTVIGVAVVPSGVHVLPAAPALHTPTEDEIRDTHVMEAQDDESVVISDRPPIDVDPIGATDPAGKKLPSAVLKATVEESTPSGDWTMTPGEHGPTIMPTPRAAAAKTPAVEMPDPEEDAPIKKIPAGPPTGDWMIALDPSQPDGWSEPSKIEKRPEGVLPPEQPGPPVSTVASAKDLDSDAKVAPEPKAFEEAKIEIDPTLMEPLQPLQPIDDFDDEPQLPPPPSASHPVQVPAEMAAYAAPIPPTPPPMPGPIPGSYVTPPPGQMHLANASSQVPAYPMPPHARGVTDGGSGFFQETNEVPRVTESSRYIEPPSAARKRRMIVIGVSAGAAILLVIVLALALGGGGSKKDTPVTEPPKGGSGSAVTQHTVTPPPPPPPPNQGSDGSAQQAIVQPAVPADAAAEITPPSPPDAATQVAASGDCEVEMSSVPTGADILVDKDVVGTTPTTLKLPCGVEAKLTFRKQRYASTQRSVTPKAEGQKPVKVALAKVTFTVKVSSSPPGATILLGTKSLGITPAAVKLPAFEASTLKIQKDGYAPDVQKITPKTNNLSISSTLKKLAKKPPGR